VRRHVRWQHATDHVTEPAHTGRDGIADHLTNGRRQAGRITAAVDMAFADATEGHPLTFALLQAWQRKLLAPDHAVWRTTNAWALGGRERYAYHDDLPELFETCLTEATDPDIPLPSRAARAYLDVLHFHPFADGNARSAALTLHFVLARDHVVLDRAAPLLMTRWPAADPRNAEGLAGFIAALIKQTRQRQHGRHRPTPAAGTPASAPTPRSPHRPHH
jgi:hypothetical protein